MRLGIRRKLIGTLMLVGLLPLALSLIVILGGGATMRLHSIRNEYEHKAANSANELADIVVDELETLEFVSHLPQAQTYAAEITQAHAARRAVTVNTPASTQPDDFSTQLDRNWTQITPTQEPLRIILNNPLADRMRDLVQLDPRRELIATDAFGELIAADSKTGDYFQADEDWWQKTYDKGNGKPFVSSIVVNPANGTQVVSMAVPIYDATSRRIVGILKNKIDVAWLRRPLQEVTDDVKGSSVLLFDEGMAKSVLQADKESTEDTTPIETTFLDKGANYQGSLLGALMGDRIMGSAGVPLTRRLPSHLNTADIPRWAVIVSKPAQEAMTPVYRLAASVAGIGIALILVLFILGVAISNREIIMPIMRLREATAAVGRGELNVRLMSEQPQGDATFRADELGELAGDFDEMTRELQKSVGALARSNEAKRRFMELAGHELRTPVTYILGVCQLAQRQLQALQQQEAEGGETAPAKDTGSVTVARSSLGANSSLNKISAKAQRLSRIIDNLLKLVSNDQFTTRLVKTPIDVRALILQVCNDHRAFVADRKQTLAADIAENLPSIEGDRDKLEDALTNLVSNAIRFSPDGSTIKVAARVVPGDMIEILVEDAGPGIPAGDAANLFEPFYTGTDIMHHHSGTFEYGSKGIGLGLAIVRRFVEIHGGTVRAHAVAPGKGTQFQILLPYTTREMSADGVPA